MLLDRLCINKKVSAQSAATGPEKQKNTIVVSVLATADPSWVCNGAGGGISGGEKQQKQPQNEKLYVVAHVVAVSM